MFYPGLVLGAAIGFLSSIAFPGVVAYLRAGYFAKVRAIASQVEKGL